MQKYNNDIISLNLNKCICLSDLVWNIVWTIGQKSSVNPDSTVPLGNVYFRFTLFDREYLSEYIG